MRNIVITAIILLINSIISAGIKDPQEECGLSLNKGAKWKLNSEMKVYIDEMNKSLIDFQGTTESEYNDLFVKLKQNLNSLISSCSMKGKAHDELHKWLVPYIQSVNEINNTKDITNKSKLVENLKTQMTCFKNYFE